VFSFLVAITEVNIQLVSKHFYDKEDITQIGFRKELAYALIYKNCIKIEAAEGHCQSCQQQQNLDHELLTLPHYKKFNVTKLATSQMQYPHFKCSKCPKRTRKYCRCTLGTYLCYKNVMQLIKMMMESRFGVLDRVQCIVHQPQDVVK
jgi:hypothetical protein